MLTVAGRKENRIVRRLVAAAFLGPPPTRTAVVAHRNGDPLDVRATNLKWAQRSQLGGAAASRARRRLTPQQVAEICANPNHETVRRAGGRFGIAYQTVHKIRKGLAYQHD